MFNELKIEANPEATLNKCSFRLMEFKVESSKVKTKYKQTILIGIPQICTVLMLVYFLNFTLRDMFDVQIYNFINILPRHDLFIVCSRDAF